MQQEIKYSREPVYSVRPYTLVAYPDNFVSEKIWAEKKLFNQVYNCPDKVQAKPAIIIARFFAFEAMEETLLRYIHRVCSNRKSLEIILNNYSGFIPHSVYLRIQNQHAILSLRKELKVIEDYLLSCSCPPMAFVTHLHVLIAAGLEEETYSKAMLDYSHKSFHESFMVDQILLERKTNDYEPYRIINVFPLRPAESPLNSNLFTDKITHFQ